jgi:hypothetical protein
VYSHFVDNHGKHVNCDCGFFRVVGLEVNGLISRICRDKNLVQKIEDCGNYDR